MSEGVGKYIFALDPPPVLGSKVQRLVSTDISNGVNAEIGIADNDDEEEEEDSSGNEQQKMVVTHGESLQQRNYYYYYYYYYY